MKKGNGIWKNRLKLKINNLKCYPHNLKKTFYKPTTNK